MVVQVSFSKASAGPHGKSSGSCSGKFSERSEVLSYRQAFGTVWSELLHEMFESPVDAAQFFRVDASTAEKWWKGLNAPQGWVIGRALAHPKTRDATLKTLVAAL
ncbi:hypothetical protein [Falsihalocynthiibacter sp. CO-5D18]|uniref:hypothetical protein n=1 Tax=Falsihalocynthiibacter sp. CO-5D18 TaxID=3240872 RepID=UPI003510542F